jgi:hypothetical protein
VSHCTKRSRNVCALPGGLWQNKAYLQIGRIVCTYWHPTEWNKLSFSQQEFRKTLTRGVVAAQQWCPLCWPCTSKCRDRATGCIWSESHFWKYSQKHHPRIQGLVSKEDRKKDSDPIPVIYDIHAIYFCLISYRSHTTKQRWLWRKLQNRIFLIAWERSSKFCMSSILLGICWETILPWKEKKDLTKKFDSLTGV